MHTIRKSLQNVQNLVLVFEIILICIEMILYIVSLSFPCCEHTLPTLQNILLFNFIVCYSFFFDICNEILPL